MVFDEFSHQISL